MCLFIDVRSADERLLLWLRYGDFIVDEMRCAHHGTSNSRAIHQVHITKHGRTRVDSLSRFFYWQPVLGKQKCDWKYLSCVLQFIIFVIPLREKVIWTFELLMVELSLWLNGNETRIILSPKVYEIEVETSPGWVKLFDKIVCGLDMPQDVPIVNDPLTNLIN